MKLPWMVFLIFFFSHSLFSQTLLVEVTGIRNQKGWLRLAFFMNETDFRNEKPTREFTFEKTGLLNGNLTVRLDSVQPGKYGIALLDDENRNGKLDYKLILPAEGVGFSFYTQHGIKRPSFDDFSFYVKRNVTIRVPIRLTYY